MKFSREYIRDLLHGTDALVSVYELGEIWSSRPGRKETDPYFGLLPCQYAVHLYLNYDGDVGNGGHSQYFSNPVGAYANETLPALQELGLAEAYSILSRAMAVFPKSEVPSDWHQRNALIEGFPDHVFALWDTLDRERLALQVDAWPKLLQYLQKFESEIVERDAR